MQDKLEASQEQVKGLVQNVSENVMLVAEQQLVVCEEVKNRAQTEYVFHIHRLSPSMSVTISLSFCLAGAAPPCNKGWGEILAMGKAKNCH